MDPRGQMPAPGQVRLARHGSRTPSASTQGRGTNLQSPGTRRHLRADSRANPARNHAPRPPGQTFQSLGGAPPMSTPQLILTLAPGGQLVVELPGANGSRRQVKLEGSAESIVSN